MTIINDMKMKITKFLIITGCIGLIFAITISIASADSEIDLNINITLPPPIEVETAPTMVFLGEAGVYTAVGIGYDLFFINGRYFYFHGNSWFWAAGYGGPWAHIKIKSLPPGLRRFKIAKLRHFRTAEFKRFKVQGNNYNGKKIIAGKGSALKSKKMIKHKVKHRSKGKGKRK